MSGADITDRLDEVEQRIHAWDFTGARDAVQAVLDDPALGDADRLTARRLLAEVLRELGDLVAAYDLAEAVAAQAERIHGPGDPVTVHALAVLAAVRHDYDEWDAAERLYHRVLDSGVEEGGAEPVSRAVRLARANLALLQRDRGDHALALVMLNAAYVVHRREYGAEDLDTIRIAAELAALHHACGDAVAARRLFTLAHAAARARLGVRHPFTRAVEWELAAVEPPMPPTPSSVDLAVVVPEHAPDVPVREEPQVQDQRGGGVRVRVRLRVCVVGAVVVVAGLLAVWGRYGASDPGIPVAGGSVIRDLRLQDRGDSLAVTWTDPHSAAVVALSRAGAPAVVLATVPAGTSSYVVRDVEPGVAYCVVVGPVDETLAMTATASVCTGAR
ncbi:tetratricopeptide repeat protein [Dactylosporangium roseum]|uniref:Tetratricopeptide repeat protein n=1 Tax=Dactylosporangium roseum TaxID=47989 RepID=A0ABY5Z931_9ACTN|nr:tetratricopeptide repeat protein [Dactylosporangium roseum]UWZ38585.1 tetratricopeptide repeat protein [Dactylosporangium roseum]